MRLHIRKYSTHWRRRSTIFFSRAFPGNDFYTRAGINTEDFWFKSSLLLNRYTRGRNQTPFSPFVVAISFLSEEPYPISLVPHVLSGSEAKRQGKRGKERKREELAVNHAFVLFIVVQKCAPYTQIKFVPGVRFACATNFTGEDAELLRLSLRKIHLHQMRHGGFCSPLFFQFFVKM